MRLLFITTSTTALLAANVALAQATEPFVLGTIFLGSDATTSIGIDNEDLTRTDPADLQDVFKTEPTVSVGSSLPISQKIYVNGVEENNLNVTIDGARQNNRIFHHSATTYIDPELLKAVRIDPGVAPADAGPGATAGAIAFETKDVEDLLDPGKSFGGRISLGYQDNGETLTTSLGLYGLQNGFEYLVFGKIADGENLIDGDGDEITGSKAALESGLAKLAYSLADGSRIELSYERVTDDAQRPFRADFAGVNGDFTTRTYALERENLVLSYTGAGTSAMWNPFVQVAYNSTDLLTGASRFGTYGGKSESVTAKVQNEFVLSIGTITAGVDYYADSVDIEERLTGADFAEEKATNVGVFAQARMDLSDQLRLSGGLRYDFQTFEGIDGTEYDVDGLSTNVALDYDVTDDLTLSAGASTTWGGIALSESFLFDTAGWVYPDEIDAVTSQNIYVGLNGQAGAFDFDAKVFKTEIFNARTLYDPATERFGLSPAATSDFESEGFEVGARYNWSTGFARIAYANIDSKINGLAVDSYTGRYLSTPLGETVILEVEQAFDAYDIVVGADAQITVDQDGTYLGDELGELEGYTVANAYFEYKPEDFAGLTVRGEVNNIFDEQYAERATYGQEFDEVTPLFEPGRSIGVRVTYAF